MEPPAHAVPPPPHLDAHVPVPESCRYVTLRGKGNFTNVIYVKGLEMGDDPGLSRWAGWNHRSPYRRELGGQRGEKMPCGWLGRWRKGL